MEPDPDAVDHVEENEPSLPDDRDAAAAEHDNEERAKADQEQVR
jgi:hypothetical protein